MEHLDLSINKLDDHSPHPNPSNAAMWSNCAIAVHKGDSGMKGSRTANFGNPVSMSEELKIRGELEIEVERDLEEEIKDGICRLAMRLQRLYQHQKTRDAEFQSKIIEEVFTEVNIRIRIGGDSTIQIHENKKEIHKKAVLMQRTRRLKLEEQQSRVRPSQKEFDWVRTLRSNSSSGATSGKKNEISQHGGLLRNNNKHVEKKEKRSFINDSGQGRGKVCVKGSNLLQVGWRK